MNCPKLVLSSASRTCSIFLRTDFIWPSPPKAMSTAAATVEELREPHGWSEAKPFSAIPGPKSWPVVKTMPYLLTKVPCRLDEFYPLIKHLHERFGDLVRFEIPGKPAFLQVFDPEMVESILKQGVTSWPERRTGAYFGIYRKQTRKDVYGDNAGLLPEDGKAWWDIRSKVQQPMMRPKSSQLYVPAMSAVSQDFVDTIKSVRDPITKEVTEDFQNELYKWSLESVGLVALNTRLGCLGTNLLPESDGQRMIDAVNKVFGLMAKIEMKIPLWKYLPTPLWRSFVEHMDIITEIGMKHINRQIEELKKKENHNDDLSVLEMFLLTPGLNKGVAATMAMDMLFAGIDTTGNSMAYYFYHIARNPEVQKKIQQEVDSALSDRKEPVTVEALNRMPYMKATVKESMRINPVATGFLRCLQNDVVVAGYQVPKGTFFISAVMEMCRKDKHYPDSLKFKPERWLRGDPEYSTANPYTYTPFGHGARMCIGKRIAEHEMWVLIAKIMQHFTVEYHYEDMGVKSRLVNVPDKPLLFQFHDRPT